MEIRIHIKQYLPENKTIARYAKELKLPAVKDCMDDVASEAVAQNWDCRQFFSALLKRELK